jgi:hypothetical protein
MAPSSDVYNPHELFGERGLQWYSFFFWPSCALVFVLAMYLSEINPLRGKDLPMLEQIEIAMLEGYIEIEDEVDIPIVA